MDLLRQLYSILPLKSIHYGVFSNPQDILTKKLAGVAEQSNLSCLLSIVGRLAMYVVSEKPLYPTSRHSR